MKRAAPARSALLCALLPRSGVGAAPRGLAHPQLWPRAHSVGLIDASLRSKFGRRRILFSDAERRTLGKLAKEVGRKALRELDPIVSPATLLRWHRELVAQEWTFLERRRPGRPRTKVDIEQLIVRMANENLSWGYTRIQGALRNLEINVGRGTIRRILESNHFLGVSTAQRRQVDRQM